MSALEIGLLAAITIVLCKLFLDSKKRRVLYKDERNAIVFQSQKYRIRAKPDLILSRDTIVEKKSRKGRVFRSDKAQLIATALAVRFKIPDHEGDN